MKILWLCNVILPQIAEELSKQILPVGGWLVGMSEELMKKDDVELVICFPNNDLEVVSGNINGMRFYGFPREKDSKETFQQILLNEKPDIVHIFGTEYKHTLDMVNVCEKLGIINRVLLNIQGLVSVYGYHKYYYYADLPQRIIYSKTLFELVFKRGIRQGRLEFIKRGKYEVEAIKKVKYISGRTDWDYACVKRINPDVKYLFCNESFRESFYENRWDYKTCQKHAIFVSQCSYPLKGFHKLLEAMPDVLKIYPDAHIYTTGISPFDNEIKNKLKMTSYRKYLGELIKKYNLEEKVTFLGSLSEREMVEQYLNANVFVSASSIENSPNSVGEAMLLGVPVVSSYVGGVSNMIEHNKEGYLYPFRASYMLAHYICKVFDSKEDIREMCENAHNHAMKTHDREENLNVLLGIYNMIIENYKN